MAYQPPAARSSVYFTRNLTEENFNNGKMLLGYYWRDSVISKPPYYPVTNFDGMIKFLQNNYPTYIESLGEQLKSVDFGKLIEVMKTVAKKGYTDYPRPSYFANEMLERTGYTLLDKTGDVLGAIGESVIDASKLIWLLSAVGIGIFVYLNFHELKAAFKK